MGKIFLEDTKMENADFRTKPEMNPEHEENKPATVISHQTFAITDKKLKLGVHHNFQKKFRRSANS